jgi:hypothetical protein
MKNSTMKMVQMQVQDLEQASQVLSKFACEIANLALHTLHCNNRPFCTQSIAEEHFLHDNLHKALIEEQQVLVDHLLW